MLSIAKGTAQLGINQENFYKLKIPIPSLERQKEIVEYCEYNDTLIKQLEKEIENNKQLAQQFITEIVKSHIQTEEQDHINSETIEVKEEISSGEEEKKDDIIEEPKQKPKNKKMPKKKRFVIVEEN